MAQRPSEEFKREAVRIALTTKAIPWLHKGWLRHRGFVKGSHLKTDCGVTLMAKRPLKLDRLPNRKPVKLTITLEPETYDALEDYARIYAEEYGDDKPVNVIASYMIGDFMDGDAAFKRRRKATEKDGTPLANGKCV